MYVCMKGLLLEMLMEWVLWDFFLQTWFFDFLSFGFEWFVLFDTLI